jgi:hypothetical protein
VNRRIPILVVLSLAEPWAGSQPKASPIVISSTQCAGLMNWMRPSDADESRHKTMKPQKPFPAAGSSANSG